MNALEQVKGKVGIEARQACWDARESMKRNCPCRDWQILSRYSKAWPAEKI